MANTKIPSELIADSSITAAKLADGTITTADIADSNVTTAKIADSNVTTAKIGDAQVTTAKITDANVTTGKIADDAVTTAKMASNSVTSDTIASGITLAGNTTFSGSVITSTLASPDGTGIISLPNTGEASFARGAVFNENSHDSDFRVESNANTHMLFVDAGNNRIGINSATPSETLQVNGNLALYGELRLVHAIRHANSGAQVIDNDNDTYFILNDPEGANRIKLGDSGDTSNTYRNTTHKFEPASGTEYMRINATGVGIGNTNPAATLEVGTLTSGSTGNVIINSEGGNPPALQVKSRTNRARINVQDNDTSGYIIAEGSVFSFGFADAVSNNNININTSHNVGIGTTTPASKLHISGNSDISDEDCQLIIDDVDGSAGSRIPSIQFRSVTGGTTTNQGRIRATDTQGMILSGSSAQGDDLVVQAGEIGIGTTSPAAALEVKATNSGSSDWANKGIMSSVQINAANRTFGGLTMVDHGSGSGHAGLGFRYDGTGYKLELGTASSTNSGISTHLTIDRAGAITTSGHLDVGADLTVPQKIIHTGDTNTYIEFNANDSWRVVAGNEERIKANVGEVVINDNSVDMDFRVESNASTHQLFVDSTNSKVLVSSNNTDSVTNSATALAARAFEVNGNASEGSDNLSIFAMADGTGNYGIEVSNSPHTAQYDLLLNPIKGGNVGIGTINPQFNLDVTGLIRATADVYFQGDVYVNSKIRHNGDVDNYITFSAADTQGFITGNSTRLQITNSLVRFNQENNNQDFSVYSANSDNMLYVDASTDRVGIGIATPMSHLHVNKDTSGHNTDGITLGKVEANGWIDTNEEMGRLGWAASYGSSFTPAIGAYISAKADANWNGNEAPTRIGLFTAPENSLTPVERMRIDSSGDVLIGQTSQTGYAFAQKLVVGDGDNNDGITIQSGSTHQGNLAFNHSDGTTAHGRISYQHGTNYMQFFTNNTERMRIHANGHVSLGAVTDLAFVRPVYRKNITLNKTYTALFNTNGAQLASGFVLNIHGTGTGVVVNGKFDVLVNHYQDIAISALGTYYTLCRIKVVSNGNEDCTVYAAINSSNNSSCTIEVEPLHNTTLEFSPSSVFSTNHFIHEASGGHTTGSAASMASGAGTTTGYS